MLIAQGANDPRVKQAEAEQIVESLKTKGKEVDYLLFEDEGHGFARPENRMAFYAEAEQFLVRHLGGVADVSVAVDHWNTEFATGRLSAYIGHSDN